MRTTTLGPIAWFAATIVASWACGGGGSDGGGMPGGQDASSSGNDSGADAPGSNHDAANGSSSGSSGGSGSGSSNGGSSSSGGGNDAGPPNTGASCPKVQPGDYEQYGLPATANLPAGVSALTDWKQHPAHGGWNGAQQMDACRYQADPDGFLTWHGMPSARLEVQPGDDPLALGENSERAECLTEQDSGGNQINESASSGTQYYATSYYFSSSWGATFYPYSVFESNGQGWPYNLTNDCGGAGNLCNSWSLVLQFHGPGGGAPWAVLAAGSTAPNQPQKMWLAGAQTTQFSDGGQIVLGAWVDLVIEVDWPNAGFTIWRRNQGQTNFTQVVSTAFPAASSGTYMKQGLYRGGQVNGRTDVLWVGPTVRGATFSAVEQAAFGTNDGP